MHVFFLLSLVQDIGALCFYNVDTYGKGCCCTIFTPSCCHNCRDTYTDNGCTCGRGGGSYAKGTYGRGVGNVMSCPSDRESTAGRSSASATPASPTTFLALHLKSLCWLLQDCATKSADRATVVPSPCAFPPARPLSPRTAGSYVLAPIKIVLGELECFYNLLLVLPLSPVFAARQLRLGPLPSESARFLASVL